MPTSYPDSAQETAVIPLRTLLHRERIEGRRRHLRAELADILHPPCEFAWEIGCGHGHFLTAYALEHSDTVCIGIDIMGERIQRALRKRDRARLSNLFFLHAEARLFLETL